MIKLIFFCAFIAFAVSLPWESASTQKNEVKKPSPIIPAVPGDPKTDSKIVLANPKDLITNVKKDKRHTTDNSKDGKPPQVNASGRNSDSNPSNSKDETKHLVKREIVKNTVPETQKHDLKSDSATPEPAKNIGNKPIVNDHKVRN